MAAAFDRDRAARVEAATRRKGDEAGGLPGDLGQPGPASRASRQRGQQTFGVRMGRRVIEVTPFGVLDHLAGVHHRDMVSQPGNYSEVVSDHYHGHAQFCLEALYELDYLGLHGHVEGRGGLVGDEQLGLQRQCHGDHGPLAHAARVLVGVFVGPSSRARDPHQLQHVHGPSAGGTGRDRARGPGWLRLSANPLCREGAGWTAGPGRRSLSWRRAAAGAHPRAW